MKQLTQQQNTDIQEAAYLRKVAGYFGITPDKPFSGKFYFETTRSEL